MADQIPSPAQMTMPSSKPASDRRSLSGAPTKTSTPREIYVTERDLRRLRALLSTTTQWNPRDREHVAQLQRELDHAAVVRPTAIPADVVTMNSQVRVSDLQTGESMVWTLVFPKIADIVRHRISVLAPIGVALIGCRAGDVVSLDVPSGRYQLRIDEVLFQPEAAGQDLA